MDIAVDRDRRRAMTSARWAKVLRFTVADVDANARGLLSWRQRLRSAGAGVIAFAVALVAGFRALHIAQIPPDTLPLSSPIAWMTMKFIANLAVSLGLGWYGSAFLGDAVAGRAAVATGPLVYVWKIGPRGNVTQSLSCDDRRFRVRGPCRNAIEDNVTYRVYYAPCSERLLSLEPIGPSPES